MLPCGIPCLKFFVSDLISFSFLFKHIICERLSIKVIIHHRARFFMLCVIHWLANPRTLYFSRKIVKVIFYFFLWIRKQQCLFHIFYEILVDFHKIVYCYQKISGIDSELFSRIFWKISIQTYRTNIFAYTTCFVNRGTITAILSKFRKYHMKVNY